jgi:hypothetical protein
MLSTFTSKLQCVSNIDIVSQSTEHGKEKLETGKNSWSEHWEMFVNTLNNKNVATKPPKSKFIIKKFKAVH